MLSSPTYCTNYDPGAMLLGAAGFSLLVCIVFLTFYRSYRIYKLNKRRKLFKTISD